MSTAPNEPVAAARAALAADLAAVARGDRRAFAAVYERTSAKLFGVCLRILGNRSEAEDALQEAYVNVWRNAASFDAAKASPISWLAALARNKAIDRLRNRASRPQEAIGDEVMTIADPAPSALTLVSAAQDGQRLAGCIGELDDRQGAAIRNAFFGGLTYVELAEREVVPLGTMKSWIRRGLQRLRECLER